MSDLHGFEYAAEAESVHHGPVTVCVSRHGGGTPGRRYSGKFTFAIFQGETRLAHGVILTGQYGMLTHKSVVRRAMRKAGFAD